MRYSSAILFILTSSLVLGCCKTERQIAESDVRISWDRTTYTEHTSAHVSSCSEEVGTITPFTEENLYYPRIKRLSDGSLLMSFENDHFGWDLYTRRSENNGRTWSDAVMLTKTHPATSTVGDDFKTYVNPDFIELQDGRIMLAYQWRYKLGYNDLPNTNVNCGIEIMFSDDFGRTWGKAQPVYVGRCWEPALLQLPSGEIQMFITSSQELIDGMSAPQVVIIRSFDGGKTWQGKSVCDIDDNETISRTRDDRSTYDGMATGVCLDDNVGIAVPYEVWHGKWVVDQSPYIVKTDMETNWHGDHAAIRAHGGPGWPAKKQINKDFYGYGPYSAKLTTGEVLVLSNGTYKGEQGIWVFIGDKKADNFRNPTSPFDGYWGSIDCIGENSVIATGTVKYRKDGSVRGLVRSEIGRLNRSKTLAKGDRELQGIASFDRENNDFWFLGHSFPSSVYADFGYDDDNFILYSYLYDSVLTALTTENSDAVEILLARDGQPQRKVVVNGRGAYKVYVDDNIAWKPIAWGVTNEVEVAGTLNNDTDKDLGYSVKLRVPWECLGGKPSGVEKIRCHLRHHYKAKTSEKPAWSIEDVEGENTDYPSEWLSLTLK